MQDLGATETGINDLSPLSGITGLQYLDVSYTEITDLSPLLNLITEQFKFKWGAGDGVSIQGCPLTNPPIEVAKQGNTAILNYFAEKTTQGTAQLYEAKILIIGEGGAGKTSLLRRLYQTDKALPAENESTHGIDIIRHDFKTKQEQDFRLNVWDFGGQEIYHATHQFFLTKRSLYILLDDTRKDYKSVHDAGFKYWLEVVDLLGDHSPVLIFQNEKSGRSKTIDQAGIKGQFDNVKEFYRGNLAEVGAADQLRAAIEFYSQELAHIGEELPAKWVSIRENIERLAVDKAFISQQDYFDLYTQHLDFDRKKALLLSEYLHDLGVFLHFQDDALLSRTVILQNRWATTAVFTILDDESVKANWGHFNQTDCLRLWQGSDYADMHLELLALMQKFELCFELPEQQAWLAPQLLSPSKPASLASWAQADDLVLRYCYEFLPKGMISRLIVRMHRFIENADLSWSSGALFQREESQVLVTIADNGREIILRARGVEAKGLLNVISADLEALNASFHHLSDKIKIFVPCVCDECSQLLSPHFFEQKKLLRRKKDRKLQVECPESYADVDVLQLLDGIKLEQLPLWAAEPPKTTERTIKIFLASSTELKDERDEFERYFLQQNNKYRKQAVYLEIIRWEHFLDAMSETRLQDEYNKAVCGCDIFVSLFCSKTGEFTEEEFDTAYKQFKETGKPQIYTFFKDGNTSMGTINRDDFNSLCDFKDKLSGLGHFHTEFKNIDDLKRQFKDQLEELLSEMAVS
ncbi:MAG: hypothetical protein GQ582_06035 [Methyloprofundus sp.]|nr:hypothetical protein [Methyloprofundus sp.]